MLYDPRPHSDFEPTPCGPCPKCGTPLFKRWELFVWRCLRGHEFTGLDLHQMGQGDHRKELADAKG